MTMVMMITMKVRLGCHIPPGNSPWIATAGFYEWDFFPNWQHRSTEESTSYYSPSSSPSSLIRSRQYRSWQHGYCDTRCRWRHWLIGHVNQSWQKSWRDRAKAWCRDWPWLMLHFSSSSHMRFTSHNSSTTKQRLHPQSVAEISHHSVLSGDRIRQCETSSGSRHKDTDQCL